MYSAHYNINLFLKKYCWYAHRPRNVTLRSLWTSITSDSIMSLNSYNLKNNQQMHD